MYDLTSMCCDGWMSSLLKRYEYTDGASVEIYDDHFVVLVPITREQYEEEQRLERERRKFPIGPRLKNNHFYSHRRMY